jgi:hypothetical protein
MESLVGHSPLYLGTSGAEIAWDTRRAPEPKPQAQEPEQR